MSAYDAPATLQAQVNAATALGTYISVHTATPGTTGASEASGSGYSRVATTWTAGSGGNATGSTVSITVGAATYGYGGQWSASSSGTYVSGGAFGGGSVTVSGGTATLQITPSRTCT